MSHCDLTTIVPLSGVASGSVQGPRRTLAELETNPHIAASGEAFVIKGDITFFKKDEARPPFYKACPAQLSVPDVKTGLMRPQSCAKKLTELTDPPRFHCNKCNQDVDSYEARYILSVV